MHDDELVRIGRRGAETETIGAVTAARTAGFTNINLDLMYGLPGQTAESWKSTLNACCDLSPAHVSCYALTVEDGTRLAHDVRQETTQAPDETVQVEMDQIARQTLTEAGYARYEISNYAKPGFECRHNLLYWTQGNYLGLGPSAQSFVDGVRFGNRANLKAYESALGEDRFPVQDRSVLTAKEQLRDGVIFGLRLEQGIPTSVLDTHAVNYGYEKVVDRLRASKLLEERDERTRLSAHGRLQADTVAERLF
jgi:oxygen-independent coproporphyrinogen-3 oxidase